jgi:hypothetical protein
VQASAQVEDLQKNLIEEQKIVAEKKEKTGALIEAIGKEKVQVLPDPFEPCLRGMPPMLFLACSALLIEIACVRVTNHAVKTDTVSSGLLVFSSALPLYRSAVVSSPVVCGFVQLV